MSLPTRFKLFCVKQTNSGVFEGNLWTQKGESSIIENGAPITADEILQITDKEVIAAVYIDEITTTGETEVQTQIQAVVLGSSAGVLRIVDAHVVDSLLNPTQQFLALQQSRKTSPRSMN